MEVFRMVKERYRSTALDGKGAATYGGRWNFKGTPTVYCAETRALATLETLVHTGRLSALPTDLVILSIHIPDDSMMTLDINDCPKGWNRTPVIFASQRIFTDHHTINEHLALRVPSVVVPEEYNVLLNPDHSLMHDVKVVGERKMVWDARYEG